jgi:hypothetical protein
MKDEKYLHPSLGQAIFRAFTKPNYSYLLMFTPFSLKGSSLELLKIGQQGIVIFCKIPNEKN